MPASSPPFRAALPEEPRAKHLRPFWGASLLDEAMRLLGFSNVEVAEALDIDEHGVRQLRAGSRAITADKLSRLPEPLRQHVANGILRRTG